jgi:AhpD family alkylhydroperoxidase
MTLVSLVDRAQAPLTAQRHYARGDPGPIVAALAHVPELLEVTLPFLSCLLGESAVSLRAKELVILRTSVLQGCRYCIQTHTVVARDAGLSAGEVGALRGELPMADAFQAPAEAALLAWVDAVALGPGTPPPPVAAALRRHWAEPDVVELTLLAGATVMLNRFATALGLPTSRAALARLAEEGLT